MRRKDISPSKIEEEYFEWLCGIINGDDPDCHFYEFLRILFDSDFYCVIDNDINRACDGLDLRNDFLDHYHHECSSYDCFSYKNCNILEMLIGLAIRIDEELMWNPDKGDRIVVWFWEMIDNLGLGDLDDEVFIPGVTDEVVKEILNIFMSRKYDKNGFGGLFPIQKCNKNQRKIEIWAQANMYFLEKYGVEEDFEM